MALLLLGALFTLGFAAVPAAAASPRLERVAMCLMPVKTPELTRHADGQVRADGVVLAADKTTCQLAGARGVKVTAEVSNDGLWVNCWAVNATDNAVSTAVPPAKLAVIPKVIGGITAPLDANGKATVEVDVEVKDNAGGTSKYRVKAERVPGSTTITITPVP
ncbi:hypothetical protein [Virgisporangium aurantiacum]|uniref:DUF4232 domain-containing protein n=1 Tax=Virgisporangium aurantiacum TaxID=175570 RepID=A0A8J3ZHW2_9ACTN|nr:hypothetical protein [Virgisporangium aurantiacum]GIJ64111.1 hypothetical protein Vau01_116270 [Virgisporangium aurantiacum]